MPIEFRFLDLDDPLLEDERELRFRVLREPLGFSRADVIVDGEDASSHLVALDEGRVVACVLLTPKSSRLGKLRQMAVDSARRGGGLGRALVRRLEEELRARGFEEIELSARDYAVGFYEKLGYVREGEPFVEVRLPHLRMRKRL